MGFRDERCFIIWRKTFTVLHLICHSVRGTTRKGFDMKTVSTLIQVTALFDITFIIVCGYGIKTYACSHHMIICRGSSFSDYVRSRYVTVEYQTFRLFLCFVLCPQGIVDVQFSSAGHSSDNFRFYKLCFKFCLLKMNLLVRFNAKL